MKSIRYKSAWAVLCMVGMLPALRAQTNTAGLAGTITDESGGVVSGVEVKLESENTGAHRVAHTDQVGRYNFEQLLPGSYRVSTHHDGFETEEVSGIQLTIGSRASLDLRLRIGEVKIETIVSGAVELVEARDSSLSSVMENTAMRELPLNGRDVAELALLQPGVSPRHSRKTFA